MKKLITFFVAFTFLSPDLLAQATVGKSSDIILDSPGKLENHPEQGILPFNAPCSDCVEDLAKRTGIRREFHKSEGGSKTVYIQKSLGLMNYKDEDGYWRCIDPLLKEEGKNIFAARQQLSSVVIDFANKFSSLNYAGKEFRFNKNI